LQANDSEQMADEDGVEQLIGGLLRVLPHELHHGRLDYIDEVPLAARLAAALSARGCGAETTGISYPSGGRPDLRLRSSSNAAKPCCLTLELKYFVLDWPTRGSKRWNGSIARQHLGIEPGKPNNAVHDVVDKLPTTAVGTHVGLLLVKFASPRSDGEDSIDEYIRSAGLSDAAWRCDRRDWVHPTDAGHHVDVYLWTRSRIG
jgi:hypothetical protein